MQSSHCRDWGQEGKGEEEGTTLSPVVGVPAMTSFVGGAGESPGVGVEVGG